MKLIDNLLGDKYDNYVVIETDKFYLNYLGTDHDMPNLWLKESNLQLEWYSDDPGRGGFSNFESTATSALMILDTIREWYSGNDSGGEEKKS